MATATPERAAKPPPGFLKNAQGHYVPESMVTDIDKLRDSLVNTLALQALDLAAIIKRFKKMAFEDLAAFVSVSAEQYGVTLGGEKGNVTIYSFDGRYKVVRSVQETLRFDERLKAAKALIDECLKDWTEQGPDEVKVLVDDAFRVDQAGDINTNRVLGLRRLGIKDERWQRAMQAVSDSVSVVGSRAYIRFYERVGMTDQYKAIPLDIAAVEVEL